ncbi:hypothetical protein ERO13_D12G092250v2, partial [Gossypium hirsutum]
LVYVADLIDQHTNQWKEELIRGTFHPKDDERILCIPLPMEQEADKVILCDEASGSYSVRSGYKKLLQIDNPMNLQANSNYYKPMYRKLWAVDLP